MVHVPSRLGGLLALCLLAAGSTAAQPKKPTARLTPNPVGLQERLTLVVEVEGARLNRMHLDASFQLDNLQVLGPPSQGTNIQIINGVPSTSRSLTWQLRPLTVGEGRVYDLTVQVGDREVRLEEQKVTIQEEVPANRRRRLSRRDSLFDRDPFEDLFGRRPSRPPPPVQEPSIYLEASVSSRRPYVGQQILYRLYLYTDVTIPSAQPESLPSFKGFWVREIPQPERYDPETVVRDGKRLARVVLLERAIFPLRSGSFELDPVEARLIANLPYRSAFRLFTSPEEITRRSNAVTVDVRPLPAAPPDFAGAVGTLDLQASLSPQELEVGDAATLTLTLSGRGHLEGIAAPDLGELPGLKIFPPQQQSQQRLRGKNVYGERTWSYVLVPQRPGSIELPQIQIPYFNPRREAFEVADSGPLHLEVRGSTSLTQADGEVVELHPIRTAALPLAPAGNGGFQTWLFGLPWGLACLLLWLRRRQSGGQRGQARSVMRARLREAESMTRPREAAAAIEAAWRELLQERWDISPGTASTQWGQQLAEKGAPKGPAQELVQLADDLHYLRYAPKLSSTADLRRELLDRSRRLTKALG